MTTDTPPAIRGKMPALFVAVLLAVIFLKGPFESRIGEGDRQLVLRMGIVALMAASLALVNGAAGQFSLGHAAFQGVGAYTAAAVFALVYSNASGSFSSPNPLDGRNHLLVGLGARGAILLGGLAAALVGWLVSLPCLRLKGDYLAIVTLGFNEIIGVVIRSLGMVGRVDLRGNLGFNQIPRRVGGGYLDVFLTLAVALFLLHRLIHGLRGLAFATVKGDEIAAEAVGVNTTRTKVAAFVASSFVAGIAGGLFAFKEGTITDRAFDMTHSFDYVVMVILGGNGNLLGAAIAGAGLTFLNSRLRSFESWSSVFYSFALVWIMVSRTPGLLRKVGERLARRRSGGPTTALAPDALAALPVADPSAGPVLSLRGLTLRFGGLVAVEGLNLDVASGECVGLIGPNGAGKSTVFNAITGVYAPTSGEIRVAGHRAGGKRPHRIVAMGAARTFQNIRLFRELSVRDNVRAAALCRHPVGLLTSLIPSRSLRIADEAITREAVAILRAVGLLGQSDCRADGLPYGSQRLLEIARALATSPQILLLDEPAAGLNPTEKREMTELLRAIHGRLGVAILLVEHDMSVVMDLCSRIVVLDYGKNIAEGTPAQIRNDPRVIEAYLGPESEDRA